MLPKDLSIQYSNRLQDLIKKDEILGDLEIAELVTVLAVTCFSYGVSQGVDMNRKEAC